MNLPENKFQTQDLIRDAIRTIALKNVVNPETGAVYGTGKVVGYVAKIHDEEDDELFGTIDVQEYNELPDEEDERGIGYHEGVYITSLQDGSSGFVILPLLYSEVVIDKDADTGREYVSMFSHVQRVKIDSHETVTIRASKREDFDVDDEDAPDIDELEEEGVYSQTSYTIDGIVTEVHTKDDEHVSTQSLDAEKYNLSVDGDSTTLDIDKDKLEVSRNKGTLKVSSSEINAAVGSESVKISSSGVDIGGNSMEPAVLGQQLTSLMGDLISTLASAMTNTALGPQPLIPAGQIAALQGRLKPLLSTYVNIQI